MFLRNIKFTLFIVCIPALLIISGCNNDGLKLFDADVKLSKVFDVSVPDESPQHSLSLSRTFDATTEPEMQSYIDRVDKYKVNSLSYSITEYSGETTIITDGTITVESQNDELLGSVDLSNINLENLNDAGEQVLDFTEEELEDMAVALQNDNVLDITISTTIDNDPVAFKLTIFLDLTVEYRVLD